MLKIQEEGEKERKIISVKQVAQEKREREKSLTSKESAAERERKHGAKVEYV